MSTEDLERLYRDAEDKGCEVSVDWHECYHVIRRIEVDGVEIENEDYRDELEDLYWVEDAYRVAERSMY